MKLGIIISSNDAETCWNALRYANFCAEIREIRDSDRFPVIKYSLTPNLRRILF